LKSNEKTLTHGRLTAQASRRVRYGPSNQLIGGGHFIEQDADFHDVQYRICQSCSEDGIQLLAYGKCAFTVFPEAST